MISLRLVLDTNIVVSAALRPDGLERTVFLLAMSKPANWYVSPAIIAEYAAVVAYPDLQVRTGHRLQFLQLVKNHARLIHPARLPQSTADPGDSIFIECADAARADYLATGNLRHFPRFWKSTKVVNSREFLTIIAPHLLG